MEGNGLPKIIGLTELPNHLVQDWLHKECQTRGLQTEALDLEGLRELLADILQSFILETDEAQ